LLILPPVRYAVEAYLVKFFLVISILNIYIIATLKSLLNKEQFLDTLTHIFCCLLFKILCRYHTFLLLCISYNFLLKLGILFTLAGGQVNCLTPPVFLLLHEARHFR
jgi:hypothetical protein